MKGKKWTWNQQYTAHNERYLARFRHVDPDGRRWQDYDLSAKGLSGGGYDYEYKGVQGHWRCPPETMQKLDEEGRLHFTNAGGIRIKRYLDENQGVALQSLWEDIPPINSQAKERLGYPTQKPIALLDRIILTSSNEGDVVFDPFCGCGTTIESAIRNHRQWIGCDIAIHSIHLVIDSRLKKYDLAEGTDYEIKGIPQSEEQAQFLFTQDKHQFQHWAVEKTGGFCSNKFVGDGGIDGKIYFEADNTLYNMVLSVKGGTVHPTDVRDLHGVLEREESTKLAGMISLRAPTKAMRQEADSAGYFDYQGVRYPRIQLMTVKEIFDGKIWHCPSMVKVKRKEGGQMYFSI